VARRTSHVSWKLEAGSWKLKSIPGSTSDARCGELLLKYGPSVCAGVGSSSPSSHAAVGSSAVGVVGSAVAPVPSAEAPHAITLNAGNRHDGLHDSAPEEIDLFLSMVLHGSI
jgi:hypothetical protein